jgi:hypothetical protein
LLRHAPTLHDFRLLERCGDVADLTHDSLQSADPAAVDIGDAQLRPGENSDPTGLSIRVSRLGVSLA